MVVLQSEPIVVTCPSCQSDSVVRFGYTKNGNQRFRCTQDNCQKTFCRNPGTRAYPEEFKQKVLAACQERASQRGVSRIFGVSRNTVAAWLEKKSR